MGQIDKFTARSEDGKFKTVINVILDGKTSSKGEFIPGWKTFRTEDGWACNFIDDETYEMQGGRFGKIILKRIQE